MKLYIKSMGIISAAGSSNATGFPAQQPATEKLVCAEPDYTGMIPPMQLRRMSKAVRIGIAASKISMAEAGIEKPDAISVGTAMGCLQDTEFFLGKMLDQDEQMLTPTAFIQSTHNTVSGQVALLAGCYGHNLTFVQRGHSFEHAVINAALYLDDNAGENILVGGIDELTGNSIKAMQVGGIYKKEADATGAIAGEGAAFFVLSDDSTNSKLCIRDIHCFRTQEGNVATDEVSEFIKRNELASNVDLILTGKNGDAKDGWYDALKELLFPTLPIVAFKNYCGEYATAISFALGICMDGAQQSFAKYGVERVVKNIVIINHYKHYYSCWYVQVV